MDPAPATKELRDGRYVLLAPLGQGSQGTTWDAVDRREGRKVAVKAFDVRGARAWKDVELAEREARVLADLDHPSLPRYVEHFEEGGVLYLVMEKVEGTPLSLLRTSKGSFGEADARRLLDDADATLTYLHGRHPPIIHRDLKPSNVIRRDDGSFAFVDFGAVRDRLRPDGGSTVVGTFGYMAPEQFQGRAGPGSDVYAIGATVLAMLTGEEPERLPHRGLALDVDTALGDRVSKELRRVLAQLLEVDPDVRPTRVGPLAGNRGQGPRSSGSARPAHEARREAKRQRREARRLRRTGRRTPRRLPVVVQALAGLWLIFAQLALGLVLGVALPVALSLLSVVFGTAARRAAERVRARADEVDAALANARARLQGERDQDDSIRVRVAVGARADARSAESADDEDDLADAEEGDGEAATRRREARR